MVSPGATLDNFKEHLNKTSDADNAELLRVLDAATAIAETDPEFGIGPIVRRPVTVRLQWTRAGAVLPVGPAVELTSLVGDSGTYGPSHATLDDAGILTGAGIPAGTYVATYVAGRAATTDDVPHEIQLAVCLIGKYLWDTQRGRAASRAQGSAAESNNEVAGAFEMNRARAILRGLRPYGPAVA